jgi:hypothetical protein
VLAGVRTNFPEMPIKGRWLNHDKTDEVPDTLKGFLAPVG